MSHQILKLNSARPLLPSWLNFHISASIFEPGRCFVIASAGFSVPGTLTICSSPSSTFYWIHTIPTLTCLNLPLPLRCVIPIAADEST